MIKRGKPGGAVIPKNVKAREENIKKSSGKEAVK
jgi:hypothetical protein